MIAQVEGGTAIELLPFLGQLGVSAVVCVVLFYFLRQETKRADKWETIIIDLLPTITELSKSSRELVDYAREEKNQKEIAIEVERRLKKEGV